VRPEIGFASPPEGETPALTPAPAGATIAEYGLRAVLRIIGNFRISQPGGFAETIAVDGTQRVHDGLDFPRHHAIAEHAVSPWKWICLFALLVPGCSDFGSTGVDSNPSAVDASAAIPIAEPCRIEVVGTNHRWHARYECADGTFVSAGRQRAGEDVHVPLGVNTVLVLKSTDYAYIFSVPQCALKEMAIPGLEFRIEFRPAEAGRYPLAGQRLCDGAPPAPQGDLVVESPREFCAWLNDEGAGPRD
jgi:heme/copper-type cytochrome/quinol oxidase subunit 2